jgi:hypothetical protein
VTAVSPSRKLEKIGGIYGLREAARRCPLATHDRQPIPRHPRRKGLARCRPYRCRRLGLDTIQRTIGPMGSDMGARLQLHTIQSPWAARGSYIDQRRYRNQLSQSGREQREGR